jgi:hypothetical protein
MNASGMVNIPKMVDMITIEGAYSLWIPYRNGNTDVNTAAGREDATITTVFPNPSRPKSIAPRYPKAKPPTIRMKIPART